jgi:TetR/AcrR family transcriptional regulator of autoinduction and epiphytic fitness
MTGPVKRRRYTSAAREAQAAATRRSIIDAAHALFVAVGYAATTMRSVAAEAGVAVQTVFAVFGSKRELLRQVIEQAIMGDESLPVNENAGAMAIAAEPDPRQRAAMDAAMSRAIVERIGPIVRVAREAAASDPELARLLDTIKAARREEMVAAARVLAGPGGKRPEREEIAATLYVLYSPDVADMLMGDYGWSPARYERWLAEMIYKTVLRG